MAEQSPSPTTSRGIYGFVVFLLFSTLLILYCLWCFIPLEVFENNLDIELPNKYFAICIPFLVMSGVYIFAFFIYPSISFIMTTNIDSIYTITDESSITRCQYENNNKICDKKIRKDLKSWEISKSCVDHENLNSRDLSCDCNHKGKCMFERNPDLILELQNQGHQLKNSSDMDISEVSNVLYGNSRGNI